MTHTRTHVHVGTANPYLACERCGHWASGFHDPDRCGCDAGYWLVPCRHVTGMTSQCPSWSPVNGCRCREFLGHVVHGPGRPVMPA